jgi:DNA-binding NarL/FixJ family response regulator
MRYFIANYIYAPPDLVLVHTEDITSRRSEQLKGIARINLHNRLRTADTIDECLTLGCNAIYEAELFKRAVLTLHNSERDITNLGYIGLDDGLVQAARMAPAPDMETTKKMVQEKFRISNSYFIPTEAGLNLHQQPRYIIQPNNTDSNNQNRWREYDELFTAIIDDYGKIVGWLSVDTPFSGNRPTRDDVLFLEEIVDIVIKKTVSIQWLSELKRDRETLAQKNIALNELLAFIEEEKQNYKRQISEAVTQVLLPALHKSITADGKLNKTYWDLLSCNLQELATSMGKEIPVYSRLSAREAEICQMIKQGLTSKDIADILHVTVGTIQKHREKIRKKLGIINKDINLTNYLKNL